MNLFLNQDRMYSFKNAAYIGGKLLLLCQEFESSCKYVLPLILAIDATHEKRDVMPITEYFSLLFEHQDKYKELFLGKLHERTENLSLTFEINKTSFKQIKKAILARNYICHELFLNMFHDINSTDNMTIFTKINKFKSQTEAILEYMNQGMPKYKKTSYNLITKRLIDETRNLAIGNYIMCSIEYGIEEKEPFFIRQDDYVKQYLEFSFGNIELSF